MSAETLRERTAAAVQEAETARRQRRTWGILLLGVGALTVTRYPSVFADVSARLASGEGGFAADTLEQARLAVSIGTVTALLLAIALQVLVVVGGIAIERRTAGAGHLTLRRAKLSLVFLMIAGAMVLPQIGAHVWPVAEGALNVLLPMVIVLAAVVVALTRSSGTWGFASRAALALGTGLSIVLIL